jgi:hypothetical protein
VNPHSDFRKTLVAVAVSLPGTPVFLNLRA